LGGFFLGFDQKLAETAKITLAIGVTAEDGELLDLSEDHMLKDSGRFDSGLAGQFVKSVESVENLTSRHGIAWQTEHFKGQIAGQ
jgi:hypothetical protein